MKKFKGNTYGTITITTSALGLLTSLARSGGKIMAHKNPNETAYHLLNNVIVQERTIVSNQLRNMINYTFFETLGKDGVSIALTQEGWDYLAYVIDQFTPTVKTAIELHRKETCA